MGDENIEKLLKIEQKEKKRAISGLRGRASRTGKISKMFTPIDFLGRKEKKEYTKPGKVAIYSMYDNILPLNEFRELPKEKQAEVLQKWRTELGAKKVMETWDVSRATFYNIIHDLNLPVGNSGKPRVKSIGALSPQNDEILNQKFTINLSGEYEGKILIDKLLKLGNVLDEQGTTYKINLQIKEV